MYILKRSGHCWAEPSTVIMQVVARCIAHCAAEARLTTYTRMLS
jgi:hypothetical protein